MDLQHAAIIADNGPRAIRAPEHLTGIPGLDSAERQCIRDSYMMLSRTVMVLTLVYIYLVDTFIWSSHRMQ